MSKYNLDEADIEEQRTRFELYDKEVGSGGHRFAVSMHSC